MLILSVIKKGLKIILFWDDKPYTLLKAKQVRYSFAV